MSAISQVRSIGGRLALSLVGASFTALGAAVFDAAWARPSGEAARRSGLSLYLVDAGLIAPIALGLGLFAFVAGLILDPAFPPSPLRLASALRVRAVGRPADIAAFVPLTVLGAFFWMTLSAHLARALLALDVRPGLAGVAIATGALGIGLLAGLTVLALTPPLRRALATASEGRPAFVDPAVTGGASLVVAGSLFAFGVATGGISGEGGFFGIYGIFKRPELDLRAPGLALAIAAGALFAPALVGRIRPLLALILALAPALLTARAAGQLNERPLLTQAIERGAPLGKPALGLLRKLTDRDGDGVSGLFGGGDCNDRDPKVNPLAAELPDNGLDEDCSGADLSLAAIEKLAPRPAPAAPNASKPKAARIPPDLNLVLITIDTLRADIGFAGNPRPVSPNIDKLAARATLFERAYSLASYTGKSVGPLMIGKYGSETHRNWGHSNSFGREDTFIAERLARAGVHTMSVHALRYFGKQSGLDRGFDVVDMSSVPVEGSIKEMENSATSDRLSDATLKLLKDPEHTEKRFFLWVHYLDPHADYLPHDDVPSFGTSQRDLYDGEVAFTDKHVGRVLDAIAAAPWGAKTAVILTSDHGEAFSEHKMVRHGSELWEELVRVPLLIHLPGAPPGRVAARRSAIDLAPTILELMAVPPPNGGAPAPQPSGPPKLSPVDPSNDFFSGVSLAPDLSLPEGASAEPRDVLIDMPAGPFNDSRRSLIHGDLKLTVSNGTSFELYDLAKDPEERQDLWDDPEQAKAIQPYYDAAKARLREIAVTGPRK